MIKLKQQKKQISILPKSFDQKGYAIMFTVILVSIISLISIGLSNTTYKQMMLASGAKDSQLAFYESDMAMECALYVDNQTTILADNDTSFRCGIDKDGDPYSIDVSIEIYQDVKIYRLNPSEPMFSSTEPCFRININKDSRANTTITTVEASGYNTCNLTGNRTVERTIEAGY